MKIKSISQNMLKTTFKVKVVKHSQNLKVKKGKYSANSYRKWEFVKYGEGM